MVDSLSAVLFFVQSGSLLQLVDHDPPSMTKLFAFNKRFMPQCHLYIWRVRVEKFSCDWNSWKLCSCFSDLQRSLQDSEDVPSSTILRIDASFPLVWFHRCPAPCHCVYRFLRRLWTLSTLYPSGLVRSGILSGVSRLQCRCVSWGCSRYFILAVRTSYINIGSVLWTWQEKWSWGLEQEFMSPPGTTRKNYQAKKAISRCEKLQSWIKFVYWLPNFREL